MAFVTMKAFYVQTTLSEDLVDRFRVAIPPANPNDLGWKPKQKAPLMKVRILGNDREAVFSGKSPYQLVISGFEPNQADVRGVRVEGCKALQEPVRDVLVKEQFHAGIVISLRSRSAAKARHARMSSLVRSGKSRRISASVMPEAR